MAGIDGWQRDAAARITQEIVDDHDSSASTLTQKAIDILLDMALSSEDSGRLSDAARQIADGKPSMAGLANAARNFAEQVGATVIVRGLRAVSDFDFEFQMVGMNARLNDEIEIVFLMASESNQFIASTLVKEIARLGGDVASFVSPRVAERLRDRALRTRTAE